MALWLIEEPYVLLVVRAESKEQALEVARNGPVEDGHGGAALSDAPDLTATELSIEGDPVCLGGFIL